MQWIKLYVYTSKGGFIFVINTSEENRTANKGRWVEEATLVKEEQDGDPQRRNHAVTESSLHKDSVTPWNYQLFMRSERLHFHIVNNLSIAVHALRMRTFISLSVDEILLPKYINGSVNFSFKFKKISPSWFNPQIFIGIWVGTNAFPWLFQTIQ